MQMENIIAASSAVILVVTMIVTRLTVDRTKDLRNAAARREDGNQKGLY